MILEVEFEVFPLIVEFSLLIPITHCLNFLLKQLALVLLCAFKYLNYSMQKCPMRFIVY